MLRDKTGKELAVGQLVDIPVHLVPLATGLIIDCKHAPMEIPGQGLLPACVTIQVTMTIPAGRDGGVWCYVVKDAPSRHWPINQMMMVKAMVTARRSMSFGRLRFSKCIPRLVQSPQRGLWLSAK